MICVFSFTHELWPLKQIKEYLKPKLSSLFEFGYSLFDVVVVASPPFDISTLGFRSREFN